MHHHFIDEHSHLHSFLHRLDPRAKIIAFLTAVLFILTTPVDGAFDLLFYAAGLMVLVGISCVPVSFFLRRSLALIPFIFFIVISFLFVFPHQKLAMGFFIISKAYLSILITVLLVATTKFPDFLKALEKLKVPELFIMILSFMYRYIYLFLDEYMQMRQAQEARTVFLKMPTFFKMRVFANTIGCLFVRAYEKGENVYLAMRSRGYEGYIKTFHDLHFHAADIFFMAFIIFYLIGVKIICVFLLK